jgi:hypothetical protein
VTRSILLIAFGMVLLTTLGCDLRESPRSKSWPLDRFSSIPADEVTVDGGTTFH